MAEKIIFVVFSIFSCIYVAGSALTGKAFVCRDPDTGKLYPINSTWPSTSFCGNYTCKLREKSSIETDAPFRVFNVNDALKDLEQAKNNEENEERVPKSNSEPSTIEAQRDHLIDLGIKHIKANSGLSDRYLSEAEIKDISQLLHNMKKSDLEAIVDVYSLAQDIYSEMDKITSQNIINEAVQATRNSLPGNKNNGLKYWNNNNVPAQDMALQASNTYETAVNAFSDPNSYFKGLLVKSDFGSLPYYYPMSTVQRHAFMSQNPSYPSFSDVNKPPCHNTQTYKSYSTFSNNNPYYQNLFASSRLYKRPIDSPKSAHPSVFLPYPFLYVQDYNIKGNPEMNDDVKTLLQRNNANKEQLSSEVAAEIPNEKIEADTIVDTIDSDGDEVIPESVNLDYKTKPSWQTDPLSEQILEEIKANFDEKVKVLKPIAINRKIRLERVGRVLNLDALHRDKRSAEDQKEKQYEAYIENITCQSQLDPGYYKMGNMTEEYPACCPKRIEDHR